MIFDLKLNDFVKLKRDRSANWDPNVPTDDSDIGLVVKIKDDKVSILWSKHGLRTTSIHVADTLEKV